MIEIVLSPLQYILAIIAGLLVGFSLGLIGGGGSILAVPLLLYFVGLATVPSQYTSSTVLASQYINTVDHMALGTTALAVGLNAYINSYMHFRRGNVKLLEGVSFTIPGVAGATLGSYVSHITPGKSLLFFFGILMIVVALLMLRQRSADRVKGIPDGGLARLSLVKIIPSGLLVGFASGFFGIGGGFLIVPGLLFSTGLCMIKAVGTSLIAVGTFGMTSAIVYSIYGYVLPVISLLYLVGGVVGGYAGASISSKMPRGMLRKIFAVIIILVAIYIIVLNYKGIFLLIH
ncbi:sulfite exporter TauE/SafE family protein [Metallosphaera hakonensis]|uniref:Probable membrane transporter protein n=1 Tax=Metallosphaera hakonensis JCM 8857 = DSM 7519 TaxID=1293036 RepID=A0A2U9IUG3_9CREN|nr:sulfite exporter TauE/SafE family protein [Metallosphaera hakonensis]AWR99664.1 TSUP family transporter [Metallosphaera hakonensis JCM 8857 = DSM 7519]